jgi:hypothetical protein
VAFAFRAVRCDQHAVRRSRQQLPYGIRTKASADVLVLLHRRGGPAPRAAAPSPRKWREAEAAIEEAVPADVPSSALYARFRKEHTFGRLKEKLLPAMRCRFRRSRRGQRAQWPSEAQFVAIRIGHVKEPLAPLGIARCRVRSITRCDHTRIEAVDIGMVKDDTSPPGPLSFCRLCHEIEETVSSPKACKCGVITATNDFKSQHAVKVDGARHIVRGERDGTDAFDHCGTLYSSDRGDLFPKACCVAAPDTPLCEHKI